MVMVGEFVGGAALGAAFGLLFDVVKKAVGKPTAFKSLIENIKFSLDFLKPLIEKIGEHNVELGLPDEEIKYLTKEMEEGVKLVKKASKTVKYIDSARSKRWKGDLNFGKKTPRPTNGIVKRCKGDLGLAEQNSNQLIESAKNGKETLDLVRQTSDQLIESTRHGKETLVVAQQMKRLLKRIECLVPFTYKGHSRYSSGSRVSKASRSAGRGRILETSNLRVYRFSELKDATQNFKGGELGHGGFGNMFKGWVDEKTLAPSKVGTGLAIAVKIFHSESIEAITQWQSEVNFLGRVSHPNLVKLLGYCCEGKKVLLVYEFMQKKSLHHHLFGGFKEALSWENRLKIAIGAARGLTVLHSLQIIDRDVNPSNILLDRNYSTKISGFSSAKWGPAHEELHVSTEVSGIVGRVAYIDPVYSTTGRLSVKIDVYSFGVLLLEILTGSRADNLNRPEGHSLVSWAIPPLSDVTKLQIIVDEQIKGQYSSQEALQTAYLIQKCLQSYPQSQPSMEEVLEELEHIQALNGKANQSDLTNMQSSSRSQ